MAFLARWFGLDVLLTLPYSFIRIPVRGRRAVRSLGPREKERKKVMQSNLYIQHLYPTMR